jgi:hypothetical protein
MKTIKIPKNTQLAFGTDFHSHPEQFFKLIEIIKPSEKMWFISGSDVRDKGYGEVAFNSITDKLIEMSDAGYCYSVLGNHEIRYLKQNKKVSNPSPQLIFWRKQPLSLSFEFYTGARLTVVHAGITPLMTWEDLETNVEVCYVRDIDENGKMIPLVWKDVKGQKTLVKAKDGGVSWHEKYCGRFGFVCSGHQPNKDGVPKYYNFSCNLDCAVFETGMQKMQIFTPEGTLGELITVTGTPFKPKLNENY